MKSIHETHFYLTLNYTLPLMYVLGHIKADEPCLVSNLKGTPILEWCMVGCKSRNNHQKYTC